MMAFKFKKNIFLLLFNSLLVNKRYKNIKNIPIFSCLISLTKFKIALDKQRVYVVNIIVFFFNFKLF